MSKLHLNVVEPSVGQEVKRLRSYFTTEQLNLSSNCRRWELFMRKKLSENENIPFSHLKIILQKAMLLLCGLFVATCLFALIWLIPKYQADNARKRVNVSIEKINPADQAKERLQFEKDLVTAENSARTTIAQIIGGIVVLVGLYFTYQNLKATQQNVITAQENLRVTEDGKLTDRFSKAVELLGNEKLNVRLGGIYALERIARDSQLDHWTIMEIFTAFIREHSQANKKDKNGKPIIQATEIIPSDIQAILDVIGRRKWAKSEGDEQILNLAKCHLHQVHLSGATLKKANLNATTLFKAILNNANLSEVILRNANLSGANLSYANLSGADLSYANLSGADLSHADLSGATFSHADLSGAILVQANLKKAQLDAAKLTNAVFSGANLEEAIFVAAKLEGAFFLGSNIEKANTVGADLEGAILNPEDIKNKKHGWVPFNTDNILYSIGDGKVTLTPAFEKLKRGNVRSNDANSTE